MKLLLNFSYITSFSLRIFFQIYLLKVGRATMDFEKCAISQRVGWFFIIAWPDGPQRANFRSKRRDYLQLLPFTIYLNNLSCKVFNPSRNIASRASVVKFQQLPYIANCSLRQCCDATALQNHLAQPIFSWVLIC